MKTANPLIKLLLIGGLFASCSHLLTQQHGGKDKTLPISKALHLRTEFVSHGGTASIASISRGKVDSTADKSDAKTVPVAGLGSVRETVPETVPKSQSQTTKFSTYLSINVNYSPVRDLRSLLEQEIAPQPVGTPVTLKNRGEAHITVISPVEYDQYFFPRNISMTQVEAVAGGPVEIQNLEFTPICIGGGSKTLPSEPGAEMRTYFIVIKSPAILALRKKIAMAFSLDTWPTEDYTPHITIGFTHRDLHIEDGVLKDSKSCLWNLHEE